MRSAIGIGESIGVIPLENRGLTRRHLRGRLFGSKPARRPLGADIALLRVPEEGLLLECKYSWKPEVVARGGYEQALAYLAEAKTGLVESARAAVVGPAGVVASASTAPTFAGNISIVPPDALQGILEDVIGT